MGLSRVLKVFYFSLFFFEIVFTFSDNYFSIKNVYQFEDFENKTDERVYHKWIPPMRTKPIRVNSSFFLYSYGAIDDLNSEFTLSLLLRFRWFDERLQINANTNAVYSLEGGKYHLKRLWTPSIHIPKNEFPDFLQNDDRRPVLTRIYTNGEVLVSKRIVLKGFCAMDYTLYPLDKQFCDMEIESIDMTDDNLRLDWSSDQPFTINNQFYWSGFHLSEYSLSRVKQRYKMTGSFSKLVATFTLEREFGHFMFDIYIPCILFVISSWTSFWLDIPAAPARVTLGITTMLTLVTSAKEARAKIPRVSYIHALDVWLMMCIFFIFVSLVEYATVNYIYNKEKRHKTKQKSIPKQNNIDVNGLRRTKSANSLQKYQRNDSFRAKPVVRSMPSSPVLRRTVSAHNLFRGDPERADSRLSSRGNSLTDEAIRVNCLVPIVIKRPEDIANQIDRRCRVLFPISFFITNIIYWTTLAVLSSKVD